MRILVLGASGMLGHKIMLKLSRDHDVVGTVRKTNETLSALLKNTNATIETGVDIFDIQSLTKVIEKLEPDTVINCIGIVKQLKEAYDPYISITINALLPHQLERMANAFGFRVIHFSTDCVFSGARGPYTEDDNSDVHDLYGQTKYLGEIKGTNALTLRTSIIGHEINAPYTGLLEWFLAQSGSVNGFVNALYTGLTTNAMADLVESILTNHKNLHGLYHASSDEISKYDLLHIIKDVAAIDTQIAREENFKCDRRLNSNRLRQHTGWQPLTWGEMINRMIQEDRDIYG